MKPAFSYYGGKQRIAAWIVDHLPPHYNYAEPFAGAASVLFAKGKPPGGWKYREIINDSDDRIVNFYRVAQSRPADLEAMIAATPYSRADYDRSISILRDPNAGELDRAWALFVNINFSFGYKLNGGWGRQAIGDKNSAHTWKQKKKRLVKTIDRLGNVFIDNLDALEFIERWDYPGTLFYCDPPYPGSAQGHYSGYKQSDFEALIEALRNCRASFVLSCYDNPAVPADWPSIKRQVKMSVANGRQRAELNTDRTEVLWIVDRSSAAPAKYKDYLWSPSRGFVNRQHKQLGLF